MYLKPVLAEETEIRVLAEPEYIPVKGNACVSGDDGFDREVEQHILERLDQGDVWAWATVAVIVAWGPFKGSAYLGCCSYTDEEDFRQPGGYYEDMVAEALDELNRAVQDAYQRLKQREMVR